MRKVKTMVPAKRLLQSWSWVLFRTVLLFGLCFIFLYPLIYTLSMAFRASSDMANPAVIWIPRNSTTKNLVDALKFMDYGRSLLNTIKLGFVSSLLQILSCAVIGYGFARFKFRLRSVLFGLVIFTIIVPPQVLYVPTYLMYRRFNLLGIGNLIGLFMGTGTPPNILDTPLTMYLPAVLGMGIRSGFFIYIFRQFFRNLPHELEDSAYIDGSGIYSTFVRIIMPNALPAFLTVILFSIVWYWNDFFYSSMYFSSMKTVSTALAGLADAFTMDVNFESIRSDPYVISTRMQAGCLLVIAPMLIIYIVLQKYFTEGLERTGIKG